MVFPADIDHSRSCLLLFQNTHVEEATDAIGLSARTIIPAGGSARIARLLFAVGLQHTDAGDCVSLDDPESDFFGGNRRLKPLDSLSPDGLSFGNSFPSAAGPYVDAILENVLALGDLFFENDVRFLEQFGI